MNERLNIEKMGGCSEIPVLKERGQREVFCGPVSYTHLTLPTILLV